VARRKRLLTTISLADRNGAGIVLRETAGRLVAQLPETIAHPNASVRVFRVAGNERLTDAQPDVQEFPRIEATCRRS